MEFPPEAYLVVPDPDKPSTWKLRIWETPESKVTVAQLGRAAAALGPGFRGNRVDLPEDERREAARKLIRLYRKMDVEDADIPEYLWEIAGMRQPRFSDEYVEREAMLFEAGDYPDKGVSVSEQHLEKLAQAPVDDVPILVEHADSVIKLGKVKEIFRRGKQLWGKLQLLPEANALIEKLGVRGVSIRVPRSFDRLIEVSVTGSPRVPNARIFSDDTISFALGEQPQPSQEVHNMEEIEKVKQELQQQFALQLDELKKLYEQERKQREQLEFQLAFTRAAQRVDEHIQAGRMPPIFREIVIAALLGQNTVTFARDGKQEEMALGEALLSAFATLPPLTGSLPKSNGDGDLVAALKEIGFDEATAKFAAELKQKEQKEGVKWPH
jgi:hypothetical protein